MMGLFKKKLSADELRVKIEQKKLAIAEASKLAKEELERKKLTDDLKKKDEVISRLKNISQGKPMNQKRTSFFDRIAPPKSPEQVEFERKLSQSKKENFQKEAIKQAGLRAKMEAKQKFNPKPVKQTFQKPNFSASSPIDAFMYGGAPKQAPKKKKGKSKGQYYSNSDFDDWIMRM